MARIFSPSAPYRRHYRRCRAERLHYGYDQLREVYRGTNSCPAAARYIVTELIEAFYVEQLTIDTP